MKSAIWLTALIAVAGVLSQAAPKKGIPTKLRVQYESRSAEEYDCQLEEGDVQTTYQCGNAEACPNLILNREWTSTVTCQNQKGQKTTLQAYTLQTTNLSPEGEKTIAQLAGDLQLVTEPTPTPSPSPGDELNEPLPTDVFVEVFAAGLNARPLVTDVTSREACASKATIIVISPDETGTYQYAQEKGRVCLRKN